jgi:hypothetical protein
MRNVFVFRIEGILILADTNLEENCATILLSRIYQARNMQGA